jgi:hypothetical protein
MVTCQLSSPYVSQMLAILNTSSLTLKLFLTLKYLYTTVLIPQFEMK